MSLRLPSQNKFRPTFKPGQKKAPPVRPSENAPSSSQQTIVPSSSQPLPSSQKSAPSSSQPSAPSSFAPQPSATTPAASTQSTAPPDSSPQPTQSTNLVPKAIPSSQIRAILSNKSSTPNVTIPTQSSPVTPSVTVKLNEASSAPSSSATVVPFSAPPTPQSATANPFSQTTSSPKTTKTPLGPPPPPSPVSAPRLSLLDAARNHTSDTPSPGQIRRRTPSIASRSERAPSATPQPQRASSVAPSIRGSSVTPQNPREPSATPQPPSSFGAPPPLGVAPSPRQPTSSLPPSLGVSYGSGFPPSLGTTSTSPAPAPAPVASSSRVEAEALAAAAVGTIGRVGAHHTSKRPARQGGRRRVANSASTGSKTNVPIVEIPISRATKKAPRVVRENTEDRRTSEEEEEEAEVEDQSDAGTSMGGKRRSSAQLTEDEDGRPIKRQKKKKQKKAPGVATISLQDIQPDELVGDQVDEVVITMGDLATTLAAQGRVSSRAIRIDEHRREEDQKKKEASRLRAEHAWRRDQIKRRKVRHTKNRDRARRREELGKLGMDEGIVSPDEDDSEEEFEPEPERLTPESTPEPDARREESTRLQEEGEGEWDEDGEEYNDVPVDNNAQPLFMNGEDEGGSQAGEEGEGDDDGGVELTAEDIAAQEEADADMAALRELGINIVDDAGEGEGEGVDGEEDYEEPNWEVEDDDYPDIEGYRRDLERDRRRIREQQERDDGEVVEINDETRFINAASFAKYTKPQRWTTTETELFYQVLEETGENYSLMKAYFPGRTIKQLKLKGLKENRLNPDKMTAAILARRPLDKEYLTKSSGFDPTRPWDKEEALFEEAKSDADRLKELDSTRPAGEVEEVDEGDNEGGFDSTMLQELDAEENVGGEQDEEEKDGEDEEQVDYQDNEEEY